MRRLFPLFALPMAMAAYSQSPEYTAQEKECLEIIERYVNAGSSEITTEDKAKLYAMHAFVFRYIEENLTALVGLPEAAKIYGAMATGIERGWSEVDYSKELASSVIRYLEQGWYGEPEKYGEANRYLQIAARANPDSLTPDAEALLRSALEDIAARSNEPHGTGYEWILFAGKVMGRDCLDYLARIVDAYWWKASQAEGSPAAGPLNTVNLGANTVFASMLASARIYRSDDIQACLDIIDRSARSDFEILYRARAPLLYINRPEIVDYLAGYLDSTESRPALPHDPKGQQEYASMYAAFLLGHLLPDLKAEAEAYLETLQANADQDDPQRDEAIVKAYIDFHKAWLADRSRWEPLLQRE